MTAASFSTFTASGLPVELASDPLVAGAYQLVVDGVPQSHVNMADPSELFYEYVRRVGHVIDLVRPGGNPITALHLGGGAFTLPRYIEATRPGSQQIVIEVEAEIISLVQQVLPLPSHAKIAVRQGDAGEAIVELASELGNTVDVLTVDVYSGEQMPENIGGEFYRKLMPLLAPNGVLIVNIADNSDLALTQKHTAIVRSLLPDVAIAADTRMLNGKMSGNAVLIAGSGLNLPEWKLVLLDRGPYPAKIIYGAELATFEPQQEG